VRLIRYKDHTVTEPQYQILELIEPGWIFVRKDFAHGSSIKALERNGWIDVRRRDDYLLVRLTPAGREFRDGVMIRRARIKNAAIQKAKRKK